MLTLRVDSKSSAFLQLISEVWGMFYSIGEVAAMMNLSTHTLRFYDKEGLLPMMERSASGIRLFKDADIERLKMIECLKTSGMSIREIKQFFDWYMEGDTSLEKRQKMFYDRKKSLMEQMAKLQKTLAAVNYKCWYYDTAVEAGTEDILKNMSPEDMPPEIRKLRKSSGLF